MSEAEREPAAPEVTIVVTTRDRHELARRAVSSCLRQTHGDLEVIVVDDGSRPPFRSDTDDPRVRVVRHQRSRGVCAARNRGLAEARGRWITFLDDDDELREDMVERSLGAARSSRLPPPVAVLAGAVLVGSDGEEREVLRPITLPRGSSYFLEDTEEGGFQTHATLLAPVEVLRAIGGWDEELRASEHDDLFLRLNPVCSLQGVPEPTYRITQDADARLHSPTVERAAAMERTVLKHEEVFRRHPRKSSHYMASVGITYLRAGRWWPAVRWTTRALLLGRPRLRHVVWWLAAVTGPPGLATWRALRRVVWALGGHR